MWLKQKLAERIDGVELSGRKVGDVLELPPRDASLLMAEGHAEPDRRACVRGSAASEEKARRAARSVKTGRTQEWQVPDAARIVPSSRQQTGRTGDQAGAESVDETIRRNGLSENARDVGVRVLARHTGHDNDRDPTDMRGGGQLLQDDVSADGRES